MAIATASWIGLALAGGRYRVTAKLGEGGMGYVYRAADGNLDSEVVIKAPRSEVLEDAEFASRFAREVRALVRLQHPNIVHVLDVGEHEGLPYAVLQYLSGGSLRDKQRQQANRTARDRLQTLTAWLPGVAAALDFIHGQGYIHRDVKPENILFDGHEHVFLSDFGVAKVVTERQGARPSPSLTGTGVVLGTPHYMAPELILEQSYDGRVDQYALAVTVYALLSGTYPFDGPTAPSILVKHSTMEAARLDALVPEVPARLADAVHQALAKEPGRRFADCASFAHAVLAALAAAPASAPAADAPTASAPAKTQPCPDCGKRFVYTSALQGKRVRCVQCGARFRVREPSTVTQLCAAVATPRSDQTKLAPTLAASRAVPGRVGRPKPRVPRFALAALAVAILAAGATALVVKQKKPTAPAAAALPVEAVPVGGAAAPAGRIRLLPLDPVSLAPGEQVRFKVFVERGAYQNMIGLHLKGLPAGLGAEPTTIRVGESVGWMVLQAATSAQNATVEATVQATLMPDAQLDTDSPLTQTIRITVKRPPPAAPPELINRDVPDPPKIVPPRKPQPPPAQAQQKPPRRMQGFVVQTSKGAMFIDVSGRVERFNEDGQATGCLAASQGLVYLYDSNRIRVYDLDGTLQRTISVTHDALNRIRDREGYRALTVLPNNEFAVICGYSDSIYLFGGNGQHLQTVSMLSDMNSRWQKVHGMVVDNALVVCKSGDRQLVRMDLRSRDLSLFKVFPWATDSPGAIAFDPAKRLYYVCTRLIAYHFEGSNRPLNTATTKPIGSVTKREICGIVARGDFVYVSVNSEGRVYQFDLRIDLKNRKPKVVAESLADPTELVFVSRPPAKS